MNKHCLIVAGLVIAQSIALPVLADDDFYGVVESRPETKVGTWVVGGRTIQVTEETELDEDYGALTGGACVEVEMEDGVVEELESEPASKCEL